MFSFVVRTALLAIIGFMPSEGGGAIGSLDYTAEERRLLAKRSVFPNAASHHRLPNHIWNPVLSTKLPNVHSSKPHN